MYQQVKKDKKIYYFYEIREVGASSQLESILKDEKKLRNIDIQRARNNQTPIENIKIDGLVFFKSDLYQYNYELNIFKKWTVEALLTSWYWNILHAKNISTCMHFTDKLYQHLCQHDPKYRAHFEDVLILFLVFFLINFLARF